MLHSTDIRGVIRQENARQPPKQRFAADLQLTIHVAVHILLVFLQQGLTENKHRLQKGLYSVLV